MKKSLKVLYIGLGFLFTGIGLTGAVLPVLPTTPFLLLASFFFSRGSERFNRWFTSTKLYKNHLEEFVQNRSMTLKTKLRLVTLASSFMLLSAYLVRVVYFRSFIVLAILYLYYYFAFRIKTIKPEAEEEVRLTNADRI
ncbi:MAG: YbaN family protein [Limnochordia bacterium]|jgi:uncharacterized membrane protein YbaN (DUF454 family)|nr:YbaN family protein [Limnochordia bacterium]